MAGDVVNLKVCSPLKLYSGLTGNYHANCHYSYNLPLYTILTNYAIITALKKMNKLLRTYLLGFDYSEVTQITLKSTTSDSIKNYLSDFLLPDTVKTKNNGESLIFVQNLLPRFLNNYQQMYFIYKIESTFLKSQRDCLETKYYLDASVKVQSFISSFYILLIFAFLFSQEFIAYPENIIALQTGIWFWFFFIASIIYKIILGYFIYADIKHYRKKLTCLI